jgi:hypothetical protein
MRCAEQNGAACEVITKRAGNTGFRCLKRGHPSENNPRQHGNSRRKRQQSPVEAKSERDMDGQREFDNVQEVHEPRREQQSNAATAQREQNAFGQQLLDQTPTAGPQRQPDGNFLPSVDLARQQDIRQLAQAMTQNQPDNAMTMTDDAFTATSAAG